MHSELEKLVHLQHTEQRILTLTGQIASYPKQVKERETALALAESEFAANSQSLSSEDKNRRSMESTADDLRRKALRYRGQMDTVQNQSQVQALEHEIGFAEQEVRRLEDAALESLMRTEALEEAKLALHSTVERRKQQLAEKRAEVKISIKQDDAERLVLQQQRHAIRTTVAEDMLSIYDRLAASRKTAIAEAADQRCSACQMMIRPQKWNELSLDAILYCDSCGRMLYFSAPVDHSQNIALPATDRTRQ